MYLQFKSEQERVVSVWSSGRLEILVRRGYFSSYAVKVNSL